MSYLSETLPISLRPRKKNGLGLSLPGKMEIGRKFVPQSRQRARQVRKGVQVQAHAVLPCACLCQFLYIHLSPPRYELFEARGPLRNSLSLSLSLRVCVFVCVCVCVRVCVCVCESPVLSFYHNIRFHSICVSSLCVCSPVFSLFLSASIPLGFDDPWVSIRYSQSSAWVGVKPPPLGWVPDRPKYCDFLKLAENHTRSESMFVLHFFNTTDASGYFSLNSLELAFFKKNQTV